MRKRKKSLVGYAYCDWKLRWCNSLGLKHHEVKYMTMDNEGRTGVTNKKYGGHISKIKVTIEEI